ncbi:hypothetical protein LCGC14_1627840 [marine sediment metagenome]|uniref:Uncharacterized protein n=1 Tax=marine sediment metagenome TaxID=412755 RepID=A0A0F9I3U9_9ZZZZ
MKIKKFIGALFLSLALLGGGTDWVHAQEDDAFVQEDEDYNSSFKGPLVYCIRKDSAAAFATHSDQTQPIICDDEGKLYTTSEGGSGGAVTNAGTFVVQEDGAALTAQQAIQAAVEGTVTVDLAGNNDVVATAGLLHGNSPTTEVAILLMIDGSGDTDVVTTNLSKSSAITITGSGRITKICLIVEGTAPFSEDGTVYFFDADPSITSNTADMTVAEAITVVSMISLKGADYNDNFATIKINCQAADESFHAITHVVYEQEGSTTIANQDFRLHIWYERRS